MSAPKPHPNLSQWHSLQDAYENGLRDGRAEGLEDVTEYLRHAQRRKWTIPEIMAANMEKASLVLSQIKRLQELGDFCGDDPTPSQRKFIALMLRNERLEALKDKT